MKLKLTVGAATLAATLVDGEAARDFASLLPLDLTMNDLFRREKFARLPRPISASGDRRHAFEAGQIAYWPPGPDLAIFYRHDGQSIPDPGIVVLGNVESGLEAFHPGIVARVIIELA